MALAINTLSSSVFVHVVDWLALVFTKFAFSVFVYVVYWAALVAIKLLTLLAYFASLSNAAASSDNWFKAIGAASINVSNNVSTSVLG